MFTNTKCLLVKHSKADTGEFAAAKQAHWVDRESILSVCQNAWEREDDKRQNKKVIKL